MYNQLFSFITKHDILYQHQYGFQKSFNTLLTDVIESLEKKNKSICIFLDFAKAFDTVNHQILLKKIKLLWNKRLTTQMVWKLSLESNVLALGT